MAHHYPEVEGGGSLILAWQVRNKKVLVIGGGEVGSMPCQRHFTLCLQKDVDIDLQGA